MSEAVVDGLSAEKIRQTAQKVLDGAEFHTELQKSDLSETRRWLAELLDKLLSPFFSLSDTLLATSPVLYWVTLSVLLGIVGVLLYHIIYSIRQNLKRRKLTPLKTPDIAELTPAELLHQAMQHAGHGEYPYALRLLLRSALLRLGRGRMRRAATNREYIRQYRGRPVCRPLVVLVKLVDYKWFGSQPCSQEEWLQGLSAHKKITDIIRQNNSATTSSEDR